ncbi:MAG: zinc ribbon domain-containing protein [Methanobacterium sp.]|uniref:zinc ribbon domain-containing protein n=1 Tax=Methanobacterium sp. TaxID=2164 RepID=UPI003D6517DD|nr:zinc ribbon domain-containing protein [Methanobacterium sp.]
MNKYNFCPECGKKNVENAKFCMECGVSLETSGSMIKGLENQDTKETESKADKFKDNPEKRVSLNLTPAESLVILDHKQYHGFGVIPKELFKVTLIDLIFKNVFKLNVQEVEKKGIFGKKIVKETYLEEGKNFNMPLKPHEEVFRKYLPHKADSKRLRKLQQRVGRAHKNNYAKKKLLEPLSLEGFFNVEKKFSGRKYSLSDKGIETRQMILDLKEEGRDLDDWIETDPQRAKAYLMMGGSNVFLTDDYYFEWFKNNSKKIAALFIGVAVVGVAYRFSNIRWYSAFTRHSHDGIDFDDFDDFDSFDDSFNDIFSDYDVFDTFDSMDFSDFDSGFDSGDGGGDFGGGGE